MGQLTDPPDRCAAPEVVDGEPEAGGAPGSETLGVTDGADELSARLSDVEGRYLRLMADFENFRRRSLRDLGQAGNRATGDAARVFLPVLDNLERAEAAAAGADAALRDGLAMVVRQAKEALSSLGVAPVPGVGEPFDPQVHEAVGEAVTDAVAPGQVAELLTVGYRLGDRVLRPALVRVAAAPSGVGPEDGPQG